GELAAELPGPAGVHPGGRQRREPGPAVGEPISIAATDTAALEPQPVPDEPPIEQAATPAEWVRINLFGSPLNSVMTVVFGGLILYSVYRAFIFVFVSGRWDIIRVNLTNLMVGRFPRDQLFRPWVAIFIAAFVAGVATGVSARARSDARLGRLDALKRAAPMLLMLVVLL